MQELDPKQVGWNEGARENVQETTITDEVNPDYRDEVDLSLVSDDKLKERLRNMLPTFSSMWKGRLGRKGAKEHRIDLKPGSNTPHQMSYRRGLYMRVKK